MEFLLGVAAPVSELRAPFGPVEVLFIVLYCIQTEQARFLLRYIGNW